MAFEFTCNRPSSVRCMVTHLLGWAPFVVIAVINESNSSRFSFNFLTNDSIARFAKLSLSPPCRWHINECTIDRHASADVGAFGIGFMSWIQKFNKQKIKISVKARIEINVKRRPVLFVFLLCKTIQLLWTLVYNCFRCYCCCCWCCCFNRIFDDLQFKYADLLISS